MSCTTAAIRFTGTTAIWRAASNATPPHAAPPTLPGRTSVPSNEAGVNGPSFRSGRMRATHASRSAAVAPEQLPRLRRLEHHVYAAPVLRDGDKRRWRRIVVVPEVVVHGLEMPGDFSAGRV